jgi:hypothetical protein
MQQVEKMGIVTASQIPGGLKIYGLCSNYKQKLETNGSKVDRFTQQMSYQDSFLESSIEKFATLPHMLQTIDTSCKHCLTCSQLHVESSKDWVESL